MIEPIRQPPRGELLSMTTLHDLGTTVQATVLEVDR
jgi:hypothetical protein